jgi:hypothetical protein
MLKEHKIIGTIKRYLWDQKIIVDINAWKPMQTLASLTKFVPLSNSDRLPSVFPLRSKCTGLALRGTGF